MVAKGRGRQMRPFCPQLAYCWTEGWHIFFTAYELPEVKNESAGNRIRGQMNVFPLNWDTLMALRLVNRLFHLSLTFNQKCGKNMANAVEMLSKINWKFGYRGYWIHLVPTCFQSLFYQQALTWTLFYSNISVPQWPRSLTWPGSFQCSPTLTHWKILW